MTSFDSYIENLGQGLVLNEQDSADAFDIMMRGAADEAAMARFLTLLAERGETVGEITQAARVMRDKSVKIAAPADAIDCCGTGGDGLHTLNISTAVSLVVAACGVPVAKHGNRSATSRAGAADVLEALGANLTLPPRRLEEALARFDFCFLMAQQHHPAMKHVAAVRKALGRRTIFNLLGPLANPAATKRQLIGVFAPEWQHPMAQALHALGTTRAWVIHGADGLDEISLNADTHVVELADGAIRAFTLTRADFGLPAVSAADIKGGDAAYNAARLRTLLGGGQDSYRHSVLANAAATLMVAQRAGTLKQAVALAAAQIDNGNALKLLDDYIHFSNEESAP